MTMRSYAGTLLLQNIFQYTPTTDPNVSSLAQLITNPSVPVTMADCGTTLGTIETLNFQSEGLTDLSTGLVLSETTITNLLEQGIYTIAVRHTNSCIAKGGVCSKCYSATYPTKPVPSVNNVVTITPEYLVNAEIVATIVGATSYATVTNTSTYSNYYVYKNGVLLKPGTDYTLIGNSLTLAVEPTSVANIVLRFVTQNYTSFLGWLSSTYSGSLLGLEPLAYNPLPIRSLYLTSLLSQNRLQLVNQSLSKMSQIPSEYLAWASQISDLLEQALYMLALYTIYYNVT